MPRWRRSAERDPSIPPLQLRWTSTGGSAGRPAASGAAPATLPQRSEAPATAPITTSTATAASSGALPYPRTVRGCSTPPTPRPTGCGPTASARVTAPPRAQPERLLGVHRRTHGRHAASRHPELNAAGIKDAAPMTSPEQSDRVSVGVFADQAHAVRRAEQVRRWDSSPRWACASTASRPTGSISTSSHPRPTRSRRIW